VKEEIREQMEILEQLENQDCKENQVKKDYWVIEENKVTKVQKDIEETNQKLIIFIKIWEVGSRAVSLMKKKKIILQNY
jgi:hypothetical protein